MFNSKKLFFVLSLFALCVGLFAQTSVPEKKLAKALEKNKDANAVFECEMDLSRLAVSESGAVSIPLLSKSKVSIVSGMDMTDIRERISHSNRSTFPVTFEARSVKPNSYAVTKIGGSGLPKRKGAPRKRKPAGSVSGSRTSPKCRFRS